MNYSVNELLARLQNGETPDDIANECAQALNAAIELDKKQKEAEAAAALQKQKETALDEIAARIAADVATYVRTADSDFAELSDVANINGADVREVLDAALVATKSFAGIAALAAKADKPPVAATPKAPQTAEQIINDFLNAFVN
jgi:hypothetical protein